MNPLINKAVKTGLGLAAGLGAVALIDKFVPLKKKDGTPLVLSGGLTTKSKLTLIGIAAGGAAVLYFAGKILKINFLKS